MPMTSPSSSQMSFERVATSSRTELHRAPAMGVWGMIRSPSSQVFPMTTCKTCGGRSTRIRQREEVLVSGRRFVVTLPARSCRSCGVSVDPASHERMDLEIACELARDGPASGETFRFMRTALGMRAVELADLLGVAAETVSRWENEQRSVDGPAWIALGSIVLEKARLTVSTLERLRALRGPRARARSVRIVLPENG